MFGFSAPPVSPNELIRRVIDETTPNPSVMHENRQQIRYNRTLPLVLTPEKRPGKPDIARGLMGITQDLSDTGLSAITLEPIQDMMYCVSIWPESDEFKQPIHLRCQATNSRQFAHGFWISGLYVLEPLTEKFGGVHKKLTVVAKNSLRPPAASAT